jgi:phospholipase C
MGSHPSRYYNPPNLHPSLPNYLWLEAGTNFGLDDVRSVWAHSQSTRQHLVTLLKNAGISWKSYAEEATGTECPLGQWYTPMVFFDDVTNNNDWHSTYCISHTRPLTELWSDLKYDRTAHYSFIKPDLCHNMHSACNRDNQIREGDAWLNQHVPLVLNSAAYKNGGVIFILFDEANQGDGPIPLLILSPYAKRGYTNYTYYNHGSMLRTIEEIFGVGPLLRNAAKESDLREFFTEFP